MYTHSDQEMVHRVVQRFGRFAVRPTVDETTTHVICGSVRRTYNILLGSVKGCWMLPLEWVRPIRCCYETNTHNKVTAVVFIYLETWKFISYK